MRARLAVIIAALVLVSPAAQSRPALLVLLVIDQMRTDYIDRFGVHWEDGLRRLLRDGAWFREAGYPYLGTVTCPGHATIGTGSFPARHGLIQNRWWDRAAGRRVTCTDDSAVEALGYGRPARWQHSAHRLETTTIADELDRQSGGASRAVSLSWKPRSAVALIGRRADAVVWFDESARTWATSTAYAPEPVPAVRAFLDAHPVAREFERIWERRRPAADYVYEDEGPGERPEHGRAVTFPHPLRLEGQGDEAASYSLWSQSPFSDEYLARLGMALVGELDLGQRDATDVLAISFSALDQVGHDFGPESQETQDVLLWMDRTLGRLLDDLDRRVGADRYIVAVSSDHGVAPIPERRQHGGLEAGRVDFRDLAGRFEQALARELGPGRHLEAIVHTNVYLADGAYERLASRPGGLAAVARAAEAAPGVWRVFTKEELQSGGGSDDPALRAASLSYFPERGGDLAFVPAPYWVASSDAATHGTAHDYDARVPVILMGPGIRPGTYDGPATPADIAPTLAHLAGVEFDDRDGRVLTAALERR